MVGLSTTAFRFKYQRLHCKPNNGDVRVSTVFPLLCLQMFRSLCLFSCCSDRSRSCQSCGLWHRGRLWSYIVLSCVASCSHRRILTSSRSLDPFKMFVFVSGEDVWSYAKKLPHLFQQGGVFYNIVKKDMGKQALCWATFFKGFFAN